MRQLTVQPVRSTTIKAVKPESKDAKTAIKALKEIMNVLEAIRKDINDPAKLKQDLGKLDKDTAKLHSVDQSKSFTEKEKQAVFQAEGMARSVAALPVSDKDDILFEAGTALVNAEQATTDLMGL